MIILMRSPSRLCNRSRPHVGETVLEFYKLTPGGFRHEALFRFTHGRLLQFKACSVVKDKAFFSAGGGAPEQQRQ